VPKIFLIICEYCLLIFQKTVVKILT